MAAELEGLDNLLKVLDAYSKTSAMPQALEKACAVVERAAREKAPKGSGELRRSIESRVEGLQGIVFTPLFYAPYVEYGTGLFAEKGGRKDVPWRYQDDEGDWHTTSGIHPSPYMRPALQESREQVLKILKGGLNNG